ncbi:ABC transporter ATP-binding protein [Paenibacillus sp. HB172176]|uniref:ABC transporter ATP-binding protein n=1 Tax=Paenibacillus sp. HB172176 TaxID=2493690 RepID=UPI00143A1055|nr:ABC transporter ATP-binding protein [Paenibacillus sp. HB172176]
MQSIRLFMRLTPYVRIRWPLTTIAYVCALLNLTFNLLQPFLFLMLIDRVLLGSEQELLGPLLIGSGALALGSALLGTAHSALFRYLGIRHTLDLREVILAHLRRIPITEIERHGAGKYSALMGMDTATMGNFLNHVVMELVSQWYSLLLALAIIFYIDWSLGLAALAFIPVLLAIPRLYRSLIIRNTGKVRAHNEEIGTYLYESIEGSREIRVHGLEQWERARNETRYRNLVEASVKDTLFRVMSANSSSLAVSGVVILLYGFGSGRVMDGTMTVGMLVALVQYLNNVLAPVQAMNHFAGELQGGEVAMKRIEEFLRSPEEHIVQSKGGMAADRFAPTVEASGLTVASGEHVILQHIAFHLKAGQTAAFVGRSGSGKSTLFRTILGFMPVAAGEISLSGVPYTDWSREYINRHIGVVFQESFLFAGSIRDNIAIGRLGATDEDIYEAACKADLGSWIDSQPEGLETMIGHRGDGLSGGQRQRVAIARVFLQRPEVLILDEPTSALDRGTEERVLRALAELMEGKTTLLSTHRLQTVESADVIYVMEEGKVTDWGSHAELQERGNPAYLALLSRRRQPIDEESIEEQAVHSENSGRLSSQEVSA